MSNSFCAECNERELRIVQVSFVKQLFCLFLFVVARCQKSMGWQKKWHLHTVRNLVKI